MQLAERLQAVLVLCLMLASCCAARTKLEARIRHLLQYQQPVLQPEEVILSILDQPAAVGAFGYYGPPAYNPPSYPGAPPPIYNAPPPSCTCAAAVNQEITSVTSPNGRYRFSIQPDGNVDLVQLPNPNDPTSIRATLWTTATGSTRNDAGPGRVKLLLQANGNLVAYDSEGYALWSSNTFGYGTPPYRLAVKDDGDCVVYDSNGYSIWSTGTGDGSDGSPPPDPPTGAVIDGPFTPPLAPSDAPTPPTPNDSTFPPGPPAPEELNITVLTSPNGYYTLRFVPDTGLLSLYTTSSKDRLWFADWKTTSSVQNPTPPYSLVLQQLTGGLIMYDATLQSVWTSGPPYRGAGPYRVVVQDDGDCVLLDSEGMRLWSTETAVRPPDLGSFVIATGEAGYCVTQGQLAPDEVPTPEDKPLAQRPCVKDSTQTFTAVKIDSGSTGDPQSNGFYQLKSSFGSYCMALGTSDSIMVLSFCDESSPLQQLALLRRPTVWGFGNDDKLEIRVRDQFGVVVMLASPGAVDNTRLTVKSDQAPFGSLYGEPIQRPADQAAIKVQLFSWVSFDPPPPQPPPSPPRPPSPPPPRPAEPSRDRAFERAVSPNGRYAFVCELLNGNIVITNLVTREFQPLAVPDKKYFFSPYHCILQADGNLVAFDTNNQRWWATGSNGLGIPPYRIVMQDDGSAAILDRDDKPIWIVSFAYK